MRINIRFSFTVFAITLTSIFFFLKILGYINWAWIWIFSPIWLGFAIFYTFLSVFLIGIVIKDKFDKKRGTKNRK